MESHSTRTPRRIAAPPPRPAADDSHAPQGADARVRPEGARRPAVRGSSVLAAARRLPSPRLTGFGAGLLAALAMVTTGCLDALLLSGSPAVYGVLFLLVSAVCGLWVRPADLAMAPVVVPIAFLLGLVPINDGEQGVASQAMGVFTSLSLHAGWLYAGTLVAGLIVLVRQAAQVNRRRARRPEDQGGRRPKAPRQQPRGRRPAPGRAGEGPGQQGRRPRRERGSRETAAR